MLMLFSVKVADDHLIGKELFIWLTVGVFRGHLSLCGCVFPFGFEGGMQDLIVVIPDHFLSIYYTPALKKWGGILVYICPWFRPSVLPSVLP